MLQNVGWVPVSDARFRKLSQDCRLRSQARTPFIKLAQRVALKLHAQGQPIIFEWDNRLSQGIMPPRRITFNTAN